MRVIAERDETASRGQRLADLADRVDFCNDEAHCTCPDHETRNVKCKYIFAVEVVSQREENPDGSVTVTQAVWTAEVIKRAYPQKWPAYNAAQVNEKWKFQVLLRDLCKGLVEPQRARMGRPSIPHPRCDLLGNVQGLLDGLGTSVERRVSLASQHLRFGSRSDAAAVIAASFITNVEQTVFDGPIPAVEMPHACSVRDDRPLVDRGARVSLGVTFTLETGGLFCSAKTGPSVACAETPAHARSQQAVRAATARWPHHRRSSFENGTDHGRQHRSSSLAPSGIRDDARYARKSHREAINTTGSP